MEILLETFYMGKTVDEQQAKILMTYLKRFSIEDILFEIEQAPEKTEVINPRNISQFSDVNAVDLVLQIIRDAQEDVNYQYIGYMLNKNATVGAQTKYGENHLKMAIQIGLVTEKPYKISELGKLYLALPDVEKNRVKPKLYLRVPLIQKLLLESKDKTVDAMEEMRTCLSEKTAVRRRSNIRTLLSEVLKVASIETQKQIIDNIKWS